MKSFGFALAVMCVGVAAQRLPGQVRPTPAPPFAGPVERASPSELQAYFDTLVFGTEYFVSDQQRLMVGRYPDARYGALVTIQPEIGAHLVQDFEQGRVIARLINHDTFAYERYRLPPKSITYWWVQYGGRPREVRGFFISTDSASGKIINRTPMAFDVEYHEHEYTEAVARWIWTDRGERCQAPCTRGCCSCK